MQPLLPVAEAQARLLALASPLPKTSMPLAETAGRWASADVMAMRTQPSADLSSMDGYAIRFADLPGPWKTVGESAAGRSFASHLDAGEAVRIFTGAVMPDGADSVVVQEETRVDGPTLYLTGGGPPRAGSSVRRRGLDFSEGDVLVRAGERLNPARIALVATGGHGSIPIRRRVRVAIAAIGDELVPPGETIGKGQLPEGNSAMLAAMLADLPVDVICLGILPDRMDILTETFAHVDADVLVTSGGASVGDHDLVRPALEAAGATIDFWRIAMRPGKPMMAGRLHDAVVLGLPGNPVSAFVTATLFLLPLVRALAGDATPLPATRHVPLGEALPANDHREDYLRGELRNGTAFAPTVQDSSMLAILARSTCLIMRPPYAPAASIGDSAEILDLA